MGWGAALWQRAGGGCCRESGIGFGGATKPKKPGAPFNGMLPRLYRGRTSSGRPARKERSKRYRGLLGPTSYEARACPVWSPIVPLPPSSSLPTHVPHGEPTSPLYLALATVPSTASKACIPVQVPQCASAHKLCRGCTCFWQLLVGLIAEALAYPPIHTWWSWDVGRLSLDADCPVRNHTCCCCCCCDCTHLTIGTTLTPRAPDFSKAPACSESAPARH